jgi:hypothetical protein
MVGVSLIKEEIYFSIGFEGVSFGDDEEVARCNQFVNEFTAPFKIKCGFAGSGCIDFNHPKIDQFLDSLEDYAQKNNIVFDHNCAYNQKFYGESDWYKFLPINSIETTEYQGSLMSIKGAYIPPNVNIGIGWAARPFVSEKFRRVVEEHNLTGLEFLWCKDIGRYAPPQQWYMPVVLNFIGRGIDSPWVDGKLIEEYLDHRELGRIGVSRFKADCLNKKVELPVRLERYLSMCNPSNFIIDFNEQFLREYLPNTDFAFGYFPGWQGFYISKRAKVILENHHFIGKNDFLEPVFIHDELPYNSIQLDGIEPNPNYYYGRKIEIGNLSFEELKSLHQKAKEEYDKNPKPYKEVTFKEVLKTVNKEKSIRPNDFNKRLSSKEMKDCRINLPYHWIDILKKINGGYLNDECEILPLKEIETFSNEKQMAGLEFNEDYPQNRISVAKRADGDWYDLVLIKDSNTDCPVVQISHEGGDILREWKNIASFVYDMILENND